MRISPTALCFGPAPATAAWPSIVDRGCEGYASSATASRARTRPNASSRETVSTGRVSNVRRARYATSACSGARSCSVWNVAPGRSAADSRISAATSRNDRSSAPPARSGTHPTICSSAPDRRLVRRSAPRDRRAAARRTHGGRVAESRKERANRLDFQGDRPSRRGPAPPPADRRARRPDRANRCTPPVPDGAGPEANVVVRSSGPPPAFSFTPKPHWELGERLGIVDFERAAKLSGSRFSVLRGAGARLSRAIVDFFLDRARRRNYVEIVPPYLVTRETM